MASGRIISIKLEPSTGEVQTMAQSLAKKGRGRVPGTGITLLPKKENNNTYRTGIDENAPSIMKIEDAKLRAATQEQVKQMRERLQMACNIDNLKSNAPYWNYALWTSLDTNHVVPEKLLDGENIFNFNNPFKELTFRWISAHPLVAPSMEAWQRGDCGPNVMFYVHDELVENEISYKRKQEINSAIVKLNQASPEKRKKVARLLGLPVTDSSAESLVYNQIDNTLKESEFKEGKYKGLSPVRMFNTFMDMQGKSLDVKFLINEAIHYNIFRSRPDGLYEGALKISENEEKFAADLADNLKQDELLALEEKVKNRKLSL